MNVQSNSTEMEVTPFGEVDYDNISDHTYVKNIKDPKERELHERYWQQYKKQMQRFKERNRVQRGGAVASTSSNERIKRIYKNMKDAMQ